MDGLIVVDKPGGITSHDVVAVARRLLQERRIGHGGTLDPMATGVLVLLCGRATRLARFVSASDKAYDATILFGLTTDTYDVTGSVVHRSDARPTREAVEAALVALRGEYDQMPPAFSAKKVDGERAYALARRQEPVTLTPVRVRVEKAELTAFDRDRAQVAIVCSAGFYVRSFAHALGEVLHVGACLERLRRTRSGDLGLEQAVTLAEMETRTRSGNPPVMPMDGLLSSLPSVHLTAEGLERVGHGRPIEPRHVAAGGIPPPDAAGPGIAPTWVRLLTADGRLAAMGERTGAGVLHPSVVLI